MERKITHQTLGGKVESNFDMAFKYYSLISALLGLNLTKRKLQLVAFTAVKGNISYPDFKEEFIKTFDSSGATINNIVSELQELKVFVKVDSKVKVNPSLAMDFNNDVSLKITLNHV